ncbi:MAG: SsrA-binding protein SmpB [Candidatus Nanosyncoccaceae bacterium]|jgi:SsrA-binding protein
MSKNNDAAIINRRARFDYHIEQTLLCGIVLTGPEVRAVRDHHVQLKGAFVTIKDGELWLNNASFSVRNNQPGVSGSLTVIDTPKKLLATKKQIAELVQKKQAGFTIIPLRMFTNRRHIKVEIAVAKGKKTYDKRETIKRRDIERETSRRFK